MSDTIKAPQSTGAKLDSELKAFLAALKAAPDHDGEVLYIRHGEIDFEDGERLFDIAPL